MENKQQTAVEWLINQVEDNMGDIPPEIKEQVKQMEKDQLDNARPQIISNCVIKEISDEEIERIAQTVNDDEGYRYADGFVEGAMWYREQLKNKQL